MRCYPGGAFFRCAGKLSEILALAAERHAAAQQGRHGHAGVQGDARIGGLGGFHRAAGAAPLIGRVLSCLKAVVLPPWLR